MLKTKSTHALKMHTELLRSVIKKQAGTISKAVLEGVMNSIDAGSSFVNVTIEPLKVCITDDGKGFQGAEEIDLFFATFGQPHEEGDAIYGKFRMGRGQMFAFGHNTWRTGTFEMVVDVDTNLDYDLTQNLPFKKGCNITIELYDPIEVREIASCVREITQFVKYAQIPVNVNGEVVSQQPENLKWTEINDDAYIKLDANKSGLDVYNLGVFVETIPSHRYGIGGIIVSRKQLDVNFARNQVLVNKCSVWKRLKGLIDNRGVDNVRKKIKLSDQERLNVIQRFRNKDLRYTDICTMRIIEDVSGRFWSPNQLLSHRVYTVARHGDIGGDKIMQLKIGFVLADHMLELFECNREEFMSIIFPEHFKDVPTFVPYDSILTNVNTEHELLIPEQTTLNERVSLMIIKEMKDTIARHYSIYYYNMYGYSEEGRKTIDNAMKPFNRSLRLGLADGALAWTDGSTYIAFERKFLKQNPLFKAGMANAKAISDVLGTLMHEFCHDTDSRDNVHSPEFYQAFHDMFMQCFPRVLEHMLVWLRAAKWKDMIETEKKRMIKSKLPIVEEE